MITKILWMFDSLVFAIFSVCMLELDKIFFFYFVLDLLTLKVESAF